MIFENTDGFEIARQDLVIRGPGEFLGARQSGVPLLRFADLEQDVALIEQARDAADELLAKDPAAAAAHLAALAGRAGGVLQGVAGGSGRRHAHCQLQIVDNLQKPRFNATVVRHLLRRARTATGSREDAKRRWPQATQGRWT